MSSSTYNSALGNLIICIAQCDRLSAACGLASEGVIAIFGPSSRQTAGIVASVCDLLGIPHLTAHWHPDELYNPAATFVKDDDDDNADDDNDDDDKDTNSNEDIVDLAELNPFAMHTFTRNFFPDRAVYAKMLATLIADSGWNGFTLIYETADSLERLQDVLQIHDPTRNPVTVYQLPPGDADEVDYKPLLKHIRRSGESNILIDCAPAKVLRLINQAVDVNMTKEYERFIITSLDAHVLDFGNLRYSFANFTAFRMMNPNDTEVLRPVLGGLFAGGVRTETALFHDAVQHFISAVRWVHSMQHVVQPRWNRCDAGRSVSAGGHSMTRRMEQGRRLMMANDQLSSDGMTGRVMFDAHGRRSFFYMEMLQLNKDVIATWNPEDGIKLMRTTDELKSQIQQSLQNKTVMVSARLGKPWLDYK